MMISSSMLFGFGGGGTTYKTIQMLSYLFSLIFYFQGIFNSFEISRSLYKVSKHLTEKMNKIGEFLHTSVELVSKYWKDDMSQLFDISLKTLDEELKYVSGLTIRKFSLLHNFGKQLTSYKTLSKDIVKSLLHKIYIIDSLNGLVEFKKLYNYGYTDFINNPKPIMKLTNLRHPCIEQEKCVANSITLGGKKKPNNVIITGTNAGGKSVTIKGILVNALLTHTCTISCCDDAIITPLTYINSQVNIPDVIGFESLFEAEMHRCKTNLDSLKNLEGLSLIVMDEIFSSTNPVEAISGAYAVCKKMSECENNMLVFTTHFNYLTKLKKTGKFLNYKMETIVDGEDINFTYKLVPGVNKQFLALELLKKNGFDADIIEEALEIKKKFV
jgi:DNA mismatch repair ATPase MutS